MQTNYNSKSVLLWSSLVGACACVCVCARAHACLILPSITVDFPAPVMKERGASVNVSSLEEKHLHTVKESPLAEHMVSPCCRHSHCYCCQLELLSSQLSLHSVVLQQHSLEQQFPLLHERREFLHPPLPFFFFFFPFPSQPLLHQI